MYLSSSVFKNVRKRWQLSVAANMMAVISLCHEAVGLAVKIHKTERVDPDLTRSTKRIEALSEKFSESMHKTGDDGSGLPTSLGAVRHCQRLQLSGQRTG